MCPEKIRPLMSIDNAHVMDVSFHDLGLAGIVNTRHCKHPLVIYRHREIILKSVVNAVSKGESRGPDAEPDNLAMVFSQLVERTHRVIRITRSLMAVGQVLRQRTYRANRFCGMETAQGRWL